MSRSLNVLALLTADWHLTLRPPVARAGEPDWKEALFRPLSQLRVLANRYDCPILVAGDLLDNWQSSPELLNFALGNLPPRVYAIPGNHDLPWHRYDQIDKSGFWTLAGAGKVAVIEPNKPTVIPGKVPLRLHGFPPGYPVTPLTQPHDLVLEVALIHAFIWTKTTGYPGANAKDRLRAWLPRLQGYDVAVFGDNHMPFSHNSGKQQPDESTIFNCGGLYCRTVKEKDHQPSVGLLYEDGTIRRHYVDVSEDHFTVPERETAHGNDVAGFVESLQNLTDAAIDFSAALRRASDGDGVAPDVKRLLLQALEEKEQC